MDLLEAHRALLARYRSAMNLVGPGPIASHYTDAEAGLAVFDDDPPAGHWADLGTGAGFPGVVFAARFPEVALDLVDSRRKRCWFLREVLHLADAPRPAPIRVIEDRVENLPARAYDGLVSRAFAPPAAVLAHAERLLRPGGEVVFFLNAEQALDLPVTFQEHRSVHYVRDERPRRGVRVRIAP